MKIVGFSRQFEGGGYYRMRLPLEELGKHGHETCCKPARSDELADGADIAVGQIVGGFQHPVAIHRWWRGLIRQARRLVYEIDDDPFAIEAHNPAFVAYAPPVSRDSVTHCIQVADLVTASTEPLAEEMARINPNVVVLKNRIDESMLSIERPRRDKVTIGWAGGHSHLHDIERCAWGLRKTLQRYDVEAHFIGWDFRHLVCPSPRGKSPIRFTRWCKSTTDYYKLIDFDIGLAPLVPNVFARSKSHLKALEYAALGIPCIASDAAPYRDFIIDGVTGWLVRRDHEWAARLRELICDEAMRVEMGCKAKELAGEWTIQKGWQEWEAAYQSVL